MSQKSIKNIQRANTSYPFEAYAHIDLNRRPLGASPPEWGRVGRTDHLGRPGGDGHLPLHFGVTWFAFEMAARRWLAACILQLYRYLGC